MRNRAKKAYKFVRNYPSLLLRSILLCLTFVSLTVFFSLNVFADKQKQEGNVLGIDTKTISIKTSTGLSTPTFEVEDIITAENRKTAELERLAEIQRQLAIRAENIGRINNFLRKQRSPVANTNIAEIIYDYSKTYGYDYKIMLAIMGVESGFCAQSFNYNCFGFLNGKKYPSYEAAFKDILPQVAKYYANKFGTDFVSLAKAYGIVNWEAGAANLSRYYHSI